MATGPAPAPAPGAQWFDTFENADVKTWVGSKGFKDPSAVAESAYNLEKLIGFDKAGRTLVIPKDDATPEEIKAFNTKLGVPEKAADYKLPLPANANPKLVESIQGWMHKAGATPKVAEALTNEFVAFSATQQEQARNDMITSSDKAFADVSQKWGAKAQENLELGKRFAAQVLPAEVTLDDGSKVSRQDLLERVFNSTGATGVMLELFANAGRGMGEHKVLSNGEGGGFGDLSPQAAQQRIAALKADPAWSKAYLGGDKDKLAEMTRLNALAYPAPKAG